MQKKVGFSNTGSVQADRLIVNNGLTASTTYNFYGLTAISFNLPVADGTAGQALKTDGAGNLSFGAVAVSSTSGTSGLNGTSGSSGVNGTSGSSGQTGTSGTSGFNGTSGTSGAAGANGTSGSSGQTGTSGTAGTRGTSGTSGAAGVNGTSGSSGQTGTSGTSGVNGTSGTSGVNGTSGTSGAAGVNGTSGSSGQTGTSGSSGQTGTSGTSGSVNASGTTNTIAKFTSSTSLGDSVATDNGSQFLLPDGSFSAPSLGFANDSDTGVYSAGANQIGFAAGSVTASIMTATQIQMRATSVATPAYTFQADTDTGIYRPSANTIGISTGGATSAVFTDSQTLFRGGAAAAPGISFIDGSTTGLWLQSANSLHLVTGGATRVNIGAPNIAVATSSAISIGDGTAAAPIIRFTNDADTGFFRSGTNQFAIAAGGATSATFDSTGVTSNFIASSNGDVTTPAFRFGSGQGIYRTSGLNMYFAVDTTNGFGLVSTGGVIQSRFEDGVAATPSITFLNDTDTGLFRSAANTLDFAAGGERTFFVNNNNINVVATASENSLQLRTRNDGFVDYGLQNGTSGLIFNRYNTSGAFVDSALIIGKPEGDGGVLFRDGSAATPSMSFQNDANTGFYRISEGRIAQSVNGLITWNSISNENDIIQSRSTYTASNGIPYHYALADSSGVGKWKFGLSGGSTLLIDRWNTAAYQDTFMRVTTSTASIGYRTYFEKAVNHYPVVNASVSGTYTVDMSASNVFNLTLTGNTTLDYSNSSEGSYMLLIKQDGTGGRSLSFASGGKFIGATAVSIGTASNAKSIIQLVHIGTQSIVTYQTNLNNL